MEYKREVKFVFYLWGMLLIISIIYDLLPLTGIGVPEDFHDHVFIVWSVQNILVGIVVLSLIIFAYKGKDWAYYGAMIILGYMFISGLIILGNNLINFYLGNLSMNTDMYVLSFSWPSLTTILMGILFYVLYRYRKKEILLMIKNYHKLTEVILPLWCVFSIIKIINRVCYMYRTRNYLDLFKNEPYFSVLCTITYLLILIFAIFVYRREKWAYYGFMIALGSGLIIELWKLYEYISNFGIDTVQMVLPKVGTIFALILSLYILYKNQRINDVFSS
ncbi:MAG TPA: hypothetical protein ENG20_01720 [Methanomicrobia archaeon]|nr:hypothetical protein [Methanomicrobia archaeon]